MLKRWIGIAWIVAAAVQVAVFADMAGAQAPDAAAAQSAGLATSVAPADAASLDKYKWLEDVSSERSMSWVKAENARSEQVLHADPHYEPYFQEALALAEDPNRLPAPVLRAGEIYNTWRDAANPRGLLRTMQRLIHTGRR